ncbi:MAG TPA: hypothetical protein VGL27_08500 [Negativicutes bacterium]|jgi:hypothetical protein
MTILAHKWVEDTTTICPRCGKLVEISEMQYDMQADNNICKLCIEDREVAKKKGGNKKMCKDLSLFSAEELVAELSDRYDVDTIETKLDFGNVTVAVDRQFPVHRQGRYVVLVIKK